MVLFKSVGKVPMMYGVMFWTKRTDSVRDTKKNGAIRRQ